MQYCEDIITGIDGSEATFVRYVLDNSEEIDPKRQRPSVLVIPGGGYDRLDLDFLEKTWQPNVFETQERTWELPRWSSRTLGACYMLWNDYASQDGNEITEDGLFERFAEPLDILARKLWK